MLRRRGATWHWTVPSPEHSLIKYHGRSLDCQAARIVSWGGVSAPMSSQPLSPRSQLDAAAAACRSTQAEADAVQFARQFDLRFSAFEETRARLEVKLTQRHEAQETHLQVPACPLSPFPCA